MGVYVMYMYKCVRYTYQNIEYLKYCRFYEDFHFPGVVGCVDCTHIAIFPPNINDDQAPEYIYINRKGYHSINVQIVSCTNYLKTSIKEWYFFSLCTVMFMKFSTNISNSNFLGI